MMTLLFVCSAACATAQQRPPCGEFTPEPPPRIVPGLAVADSAPGIASAVLVISDLCSGRRIYGASVQFVAASASKMGSGSDSAGRVLLRGSEGTHRVRIVAFGFYPRRIAVPLSATRQDSVFVSLRLAQSMLDRLQPSALSANEACCR